MSGVIHSSVGPLCPPREIEHFEVVQGCTAPLARHEMFRQGTLAGLPRTCDHDGRHDLQALDERGSDDAMKD